MFILVDYVKKIAIQRLCIIMNTRKIFLANRLIVRFPQHLRIFFLAKFNEPRGSQFSISGKKKKGLAHHHLFL